MIVKTGDEWTGDYVANTFNVNAWDICDKISDAHNASLKIAYQKKPLVAQLEAAIKVKKWLIETNADMPLAIADALEKIGGE